jgi:hypothetical protein
LFFLFATKAGLKNNFNKNENAAVPWKRGRTLGYMHQCCQMVCFQTKNPDLGKIWKALE